MEKSLRELLEFVRDYGAYVFPSTANNTPLVKWKAESTNDPEKIKEWFSRFPNCNWGLDCEKSDVCALDLDRRENKDGVKAFQELAREEFSKEGGLGEWNENFYLIDAGVISETPRNGLHLLFRGKFKSRQDYPAKGIDIKSVGGCVAIPPSEKKEGEYKWIKRKKLIPPPEWLASKLEQPREGAGNRAAKTADAPGALELAIKRLKGASPAIEGDGGDAATYKLACEIRDLGVSAEQCLSLMLSLWNENCEPPWEPPDLKKKVENAYSYAANEPGGTNPRAIFSPFVPPENIPASAGESSLETELVFFKDLLDEEPPEREWIVKDWIPAKAGTLITGQGGTGKSLIAYQLAISSAHGLPWLGLEVEKPRPALIIFCEDHIDEIHRRAVNIYKTPLYSQYGRYANDPKKVALLPRLGKDTRFCRLERGQLKRLPFLVELKKLARHLYKDEPPLIILDTITDVFGLNENDRSLVNQFVKEVLGSFSVELDAAVVAIGHPPKSGAEYSGTTGWETAYRNRLYLDYFSDDAEKLKDFRKLRIGKSNYGKRGKECALQYQLGAYLAANPEGVTDTREEADLDILYNIITDYALKGKAPGAFPQHGYYLGHLDLRDSLGKRMVSPEWKRLLTELKCRDLVFEIKGKPRFNGLYPAEMKGRVPGVDIEA
jgi:hypothetical protein